MQLLTRDCSTNFNREKTVLELNEPNQYLAVIFVVYKPLRTDYLTGENGRISLGWSRSTITSGNERNY